MDQNLTPIQTLFMWALIGKGGEARTKDMKPLLTKKDRDPIEAAGLIELRQGKNRALIATLSDAGWAWAADHLADQVSTRSTAGGPILRDWLTRLKTYLEASDASLADFITAQVAPPPSQPQPNPAAPTPPLATPDTATPAPSAAPASAANLPQRIQQAYLTLTAGQFGRRARLADLRDQLQDTPRDTLDQTLRDMERSGAILIVQDDIRAEISDRDRAASLATATGMQRHLIQIDGSLA